MSRRTAIVVLVALAAAGSLLIGCATNPHWLATIMWAVRASLFVWLPGALFILAAVALTPLPRQHTACRVGFPVILLGIAVWGWWMLSWHDYQQDRDYYTASAQIEPGKLAKLDDRVPYQMAAAQARSNLGDISGHIVEDGTTYLPRRSEYATLVERKGWLTGYEAMLTQAMDERGEATSHVCRFDQDKAGLRHGGWFSHSLARAIAGHDEANSVTGLTVRYDPADMWAFCAEKDQPMVVIPLKRQTGWLYVTERPAGYALYNGHTGKLAFYEGGGAKLPGPIYPLSLAARQREALRAPGGYLDWRSDRGGWEADDEDVNSDNSTEFTLATADDHDPVYVTNLTGRGSATAISAVALLDASTPAGQLATMHVYRNKPAWKSTTAIASRIKDDYSDIPNWQNVKVFELAPTGPDTWVATVGIRDGHTISYRVRGSGNLGGATATCLHHPEHDTRLRCGRVYAAGDPGPGESPPGGPPKGELTGYTDQQLLDEVGRRLAGDR